MAHGRQNCADDETAELIFTAPRFVQSRIKFFVAGLSKQNVQVADLAIQRLGDLLQVFLG